MWYVGPMSLAPLMLTDIRLPDRGGRARGKAGDVEGVTQVDICPGVCRM